MPSETSSNERWLKDILHNIDLAQRFVAGQDYDAFGSDTLRLYAVIRCLEIIPESSRRLADEIKTRHPSIAWKEMAAAGDIYRHEYEDVASRRAWNTLQHALPS